MSSNRISLAILSGDRITCSLYEGEYVKGGLKRALQDAARGADNYPASNGDTHIAVIVNPIKLGGKIRVIKKYSLSAAEFGYDSQDYDYYPDDFEYDVTSILGLRYGL